MGSGAIPRCFIWDTIGINLTISKNHVKGKYICQFNLL